MSELKISIITPSLNSDKSIAYTLSSVNDQTYKNIEHIIVDGGSTDKTNQIINKHRSKKKIFEYKNSNIYEAINLGIKNSTGDFIMVLNTDDILDNNKTIENVVKIINRSKEKIFLGNVVYFNNFNFNKIKRYYSAKNFSNWKFTFGLMPPHPGAFIHSNIVKENIYNSKFKIASDFDFFLRILKLKKIPYKYINQTITRMRTGGVSGKNIMAHLISTSEISKSLTFNKQYKNVLFINLRYIAKLIQFFLINTDVKKFKINKFYKNHINYHFKILKSIKVLDFKKNFVLSALNLAFLGSYMENKVKIYYNLIHWPDGIFIKNIDIDIKKIPGRDVLKKINIPKKIRQITVIGNLPEKSKKFLILKYKKKINHINLPYGEISSIIKNFKYKTRQDELIFITLPTPKQEQLAEYLTSINNNYKIICIGGSINIVSGLEKEVPGFLYPFEFIWRLRYETFRRSARLLKTFYSYVIGKYFKKKLDNLNIKII